jgi:hypothetical protein
MKSKSSLIRRLILFGTPILMGIVSLIHPVGSPNQTILEVIEPRLGVWMGVHLTMLFLIGLLGISIGLLVSGLSGTAAMLSRVAVVLFLTFYSAFDAVVGIGTGTLVWLHQPLPATDQAAAARLIQDFWDARLELASLIPLVIMIGALSWLAAAASAGLALRRAGAPRFAPWLLFLSGIFFGIDHPFPTGTAGMICLLGAVFLLERQSVKQITSSPLPVG